MPFIYYTYYSPVSDSIPAVASQEHLLGRQLLLNGLNKRYGIHFSLPELEHNLQIDANGKPFLPAHPGLYFNISHCDGLAACAFHSRPVGIDAELPGYFAPILIKKALAEKEALFLQQKGSSTPLLQECFFRFWTLKEAYVKKTGTGVDVNLRAFTFTFQETELPAKIQCSDPKVTCWQTKLAQGQILSLCFEDTGEPVRLIEVTDEKHSG